MNGKIEWQRLVGKPLYLETRTKNWSEGRVVGILKKVDFNWLVHQNLLYLENPANTLDAMSFPIGTVKARDVVRVSELSKILKLPHELLFKEGIENLITEAYLKYKLLTSYGYPLTEDNAKRELEAYAYLGYDGALKVLQLAVRGTPPKGQAYFFYEDNVLMVLQKSHIKYKLYAKESIPSAFHDFYKLTAKLAMKLLATVSFNAP